MEGLEVTGSSVPAGALVEAKLTLEAVQHGVIVAGKVSAPWQGECRRCLEVARGTLDIDVRELFCEEGVASTHGSASGASRGASGASRGASGASRGASLEGELLVGSELAYAFSGDEIDLAPLVRDAVLLNLPAAPLCGEGCLGLCPSCGIDLNRESCDCDRNGYDERWAPLAALRFDEGRS